jgi:hypothetical protein
MARYRSARRYPVQWVGYRRGRLNGCRAAAKSSPLGSFVSSSPCLRSGRQADSTAANRPMPPWRTIPRSGGTCWLFARHPFRVRRAVLRFLSLGKTISSVSAGRIRCLAPTGRILMPRRQAAVAMTLGGAGLVAAILSRAAAPAKLLRSTTFAKTRMSSERSTGPPIVKQSRIVCSIGAIL